MPGTSQGAGVLNPLIPKCIESCINLHNLLIDVSEDAVPEEWWDCADDASEIGSALGEHEFVAPRRPKMICGSYLIIV